MSATDEAILNYWISGLRRENAELRKLAADLAEAICRIDACRSLPEVLRLMSLAVEITQRPEVKALLEGK